MIRELNAEQGLTVFLVEQNAYPRAEAGPSRLCDGERPDHHERHGRPSARQWTSSDPQQHQPPLDDFSGAALARLDLQSAMGLLDERSRELLALRYGADLKAREIAELLEMRTNAVEVALSRALGRLRTILEGDGAASPPARDDDPAIGLTQR